jgi:hypothetical protein
VIKHEGVRRLRLLGKWFLLIGCLGTAALYVGVWFLYAEWSRQSSLPMFFLPWLSQLALLGLLAWCAAWVLEGFVSKGE